MPVDVHLLSRFPALAGLPEEQRRQAAFKAQVRYFQPRDLIVAEGAHINSALFLVQGQILLATLAGTMQSVSDDGARSLSRPIAEPGASTCAIYAQTVCSILYIDPSLIQGGVASNPRIEGYEVEEIETDHAEVFVQVLQRSRIMLKIPTSNIQTVMQTSEEVHVAAGDDVVRQGDAANDYFIVKNGRFRVTRRDTHNNQSVELAVLPSGCGFGEDAAISNSRRNASVSAIEQGSVLRLPKQVFTRLIVNPILNPVSPEHALQLAHQGAILIDVRGPEQYQRNGLPDSLNIPLPRLRANLSEIKRGRDCVLYCDNGHLSAAASFVLNQFGYGTYLLAGGLNATNRSPSAKMRGS